VTQQNAALVEEAAAAAESMQEQAQQLAQAVSVFRLEQVAPQPAGALGVKAAREPAAAAAVVSVTRLIPKRRVVSKAEPNNEGPRSGAPRARTVGADDQWTEF